MGKLPTPSLFVLSLMGSLAVGAGPLMAADRLGDPVWAVGPMSVALRGAGSFPLAQAPAGGSPPESPPGAALGTVPGARPVLALSPDGQYMVRGTEAGDLEWLDDQGQVTNGGVPQAHQGPVLAVVITRDGQTVISAGAEGTLRRWDRRGNALGEAMVSQDSPLVALALSPDGQTLLSGRADGLVEQWSVAEGTPLGDPIAAHAAVIQTLDYMVGGQTWVTGSQDGSVALWNADGSPAGQIPSAHGGGVTRVVSSPDGQVIATTGGDGTLRFWERVTLQPRGQAITAHNAPIRAAAYSPDGRTLATAAADGTLRLWRADGTSQWSEPVTLESDPRFLGFTPAGDLVVGTADGQVERRGPQGNRLLIPRPQSPTTTPQPRPGSSPSPLQQLPQNAWWILTAVPVLLILAGILGALLSGDQSSEEEEEDGAGAEAEAEAAGAEPDIEPVEVGSGAGTPVDIPAEFGALPLATPSPWTEETGTVETWSEDAPTQADPPALPPEADLVPVGETVPQPPTSKLEQARADLAEGRKQLRVAQYDAALLCFNSAIEATEVERLKSATLASPQGGIQSLATQAHTQRGHALGLMDQAGEAMESYNTALALDGRTVEAWIGKGRLLIALGRYEEALFCFDSALEIDSSQGPAWAGKGQALLRLGRYGEGQACYDRALTLGVEGTGPFPPYPTLDPSTLEAEVAQAAVWAEDDIAPLGPSDLAQTNGGYDPDIPLELQQVVMGLPSADTDLAYAFPSDYGVPPDLAAEVAQLPNQAEDSVPPAAVDWPSPRGPLDQESPISPDGGTAPWIRPTPGEADAASDLDPTAGTSPTGSGTPGEDPLSPWQRSDAPRPNLEEDLIRRIDLSVAANWDIDQGWPTPKATALDPTALATPEPSPTVSSQPGDFIPPAEFDEDWPQDLPPEVIAAMAGIPAGSPDAFGPFPGVEDPDRSPPAPARPKAGFASPWINPRGRDSMPCGTLTMATAPKPRGAGARS